MVIADLGEKVAFLEGLLGYAFAKEHFEDQVIAKALGCDPAQWARKKKGAPIRPFQLGRLFTHFRLPRTLDHEVFLLPFAQFREAMKQAGVGIFGTTSESSNIRQRWLADSHSRRDGIRLHAVRAGYRAGFGLGNTGPTSPASFRIGGHALIEIRVPAAGHLIVFNDQMPAGETTCLAPSLFCAATAVSAGLVSIPAANAGQRTLDVQGPPGWYRVFAICSQLPLNATWISPGLAEHAPKALCLNNLKDVDRTLQEWRAAGKNYAILSAEYRVAE